MQRQLLHLVIWQAEQFVPAFKVCACRMRLQRGTHFPLADSTNRPAGPRQLYHVSCFDGDRHVKLWTCACARQTLLLNISIVVVPGKDQLILKLLFTCHLLP